MSFTLDPQVAEALDPRCRRGSRPHALSAGDAIARPPANSRRSSSAFSGRRRLLK